MAKVAENEARQGGRQAAAKSPKGAQREERSTEHIMLPMPSQQRVRQEQGPIKETTVIPGPKEKRRDTSATSMKRYTRRFHLVLLILVILGGLAYLGIAYFNAMNPNSINRTPTSDTSPMTVASHTGSGNGYTFPGQNNTSNNLAGPQGQLGPVEALTTTTLDYASTELDNPERGPQYYGSETPPPNWPLADRYDRWCWSDLEPTQGQINFGMIDQKLAEAAAAGYTFGFRIMPAVTTPCLPSGLSLDYGPQYMAAAKQLFTTLGQRYANDPRLGWLDMSLYGCFGEWNQSAPGCSATASLAVQEQLINLQVQAFPNKLFLMLTDNQAALDYALNLQRTYPIGVRIDCLGKQGLGGSLDILNNDALARDRWRVAPLYFEYCGGPDFQQALNDIKTFHASVIGDGANNINSFGSYSGQDQSLIIQNYKTSGYRFTLDSLKIPSVLVPGGQFPVMTHWTNLNIAPAYHAWNVMMQLRDGGGHVVWQGRSSTNLEALTPDSPQTTTDQFTLPGNIPAGTYKVVVQILDPNGYYRPLKLSIQGVQGDGSYVLGSTTVPGNA